MCVSGLKLLKTNKIKNKKIKKKLLYQALKKTPPRVLGRVVWPLLRMLSLSLDLPLWGHHRSKEKKREIKKIGVEIRFNCHVLYDVAVVLRTHYLSHKTNGCIAVHCDVHCSVVCCRLYGLIQSSLV